MGAVAYCAVCGGAVSKDDQTTVSTGTAGGCITTTVVVHRGCV